MGLTLGIDRQIGTPAFAFEFSRVGSSENGG